MSKNKYHDIEGLKEYGVTQSMIASMMEPPVERQTVNQWFTGERRIVPSSMVKVCSSLTKLTGIKFFPADVYKIINAEIARRAKND